MNNIRITVLVDNDSWVIPYASSLVNSLLSRGYEANLVQSAGEIYPGWIVFMLGCTKIVPRHVLTRNRHNLVVHESDLPKGRGFAPMAWQILEGKVRIPICLLEAADEADAGDVWLRDYIELDGTELCNEWRALQGEKTVSLCLRFVDEYESLTPVKQTGAPDYYERRYPSDSRLDIDKSLREQFSKMRVADNERYPAYFEINGQRYILKTYKVETIDSVSGK